MAKQLFNIRNMDQISHSGEKIMLETFTDKSIVKCPKGHTAKHIEKQAEYFCIVCREAYMGPI